MAETILVIPGEGEGEWFTLREAVTEEEKAMAFHIRAPNLEMARAYFMQQVWEQVHGRPMIDEKGNYAAPDN
jgi:hypothetical protein